MKLRINKKMRVSLLIIVPILLLTASIFLYREYKIPKFKEEKVPIYTYNNSTNINYKVFLKPNILYDQSSLSEGNIYITEFVDYIKTSYNYEFNGEREADIKGYYEIVGEIEGYTGEEETYKTIWKKRFVLLPKKNFNNKSKNIKIEESIPIQLDKYNAFTKQVIENSKINSNVKLLVFMNINMKANTGKGIIEEKMTPMITIPLNTGYFEILGNLSQKKLGSIEENRKVQLPIDKAKVTIFGIVSIIFLIVLIFLIVFTQNKVIVDPLERKLIKIFKKHGDRLVALNNELAVTCERESEVRSIDDLVRIADEISQPIMYRHSPSYKEIKKLYVLDEGKLYTLDLKSSIEKSNVDNNNEKNDINKLKSKISKIKSKKSKIKDLDLEKSDT